MMTHMMWFWLALIQNWLSNGWVFEHELHEMNWTSDWQKEKARPCFNGFSQLSQCVSFLMLSLFWRWVSLWHCQRLIKTCVLSPSFVPSIAEMLHHCWQCASFALLVLKKLSVSIVFWCGWWHRNWQSWKLWQASKVPPTIDFSFVIVALVHFWATKHLLLSSHHHATVLANSVVQHIHPNGDHVVWFSVKLLQFFSCSLVQSVLQHFLWQPSPCLNHSISSVLPPVSPSVPSFISPSWSFSHFLFVLPIFLVVLSDKVTMLQPPVIYDLSCWLWCTFEHLLFFSSHTTFHYQHTAPKHFFCFCAISPSVKVIRQCNVQCSVLCFPTNSDGLNNFQIFHIPRQCESLHLWQWWETSVCVFNLLQIGFANIKCNWGLSSTPMRNVTEHQTVPCLTLGWAKWTNQKSAIALKAKKSQIDGMMWCRCCHVLCPEINCSNCSQCHLSFVSSSLCGQATFC